MSELSAKPTRKPGFQLNFSLPVALGLIIAFAMVIVAVGYMLYSKSNNRKYDIARPGQEQNEALTIEDEDLDTTSPVNTAAVQRKIDFLNKETGAVNSLNKFNPSDLSDQNIQLAPSDQPSY